MSLLLLKLFFGNHVPLPQKIKRFNLLGVGHRSALAVASIMSGARCPSDDGHQPTDPAEPVGTRSTQEQNTNNEPTKYSSQLMRSVLTASVQAS
jgi:hypothetical protein